MQEILIDNVSEADSVQTEGNIYDNESDCAGDHEDNKCNSDNSEDGNGSSDNNADSVI